ncbi:2-keto-4-pentenoate hydratase [Tamaricihabitans halophyticus]|uniref:2-keto-4-pentenoate hydratase n=1 Tax=Tamaricihabitans halophyticus TaxID=1262583 RepID=A0A4R2QU94_9PSEU|nr:fumarylacetoacetate hydrolase family protein [Tamaricihabitans halophyticus]TCP53533.1 2-keto-4-pentenoate hydratase [Tamaricihabitans halophyticus]
MGESRDRVNGPDIAAPDRAELAQLLLAAYASRVPIVPLIEQHPGLTVADSYAIQQHQVGAWEAAGASIRGHKVGLSSFVMQRQMGVDQPDYGHLLDTMFFPEHQPIAAAGYLQPRVEPEVAFVLRTSLSGPGVTAADAAAAVDFVLPALEIIDSRIADWRISIVDTIADNASSGGVVLGSKPTRLDRVDLQLAGCLLGVNGRIVETGAGGAVLGSPLNSLAWLANTLGPLGVSLEAGHVVLPGSMTRAIPIRPGDVATATVAGLGTVTAVFADDGKDA